MFTIQTPIIGADFLRNFSLLVDMRQHRLSDALTQLRIQGIATHESSPSPTFLPPQSHNEYEAILTEYPAVMRPCSSEHPVKHSVTHHITSTGPPVTARTRRLPQNDSPLPAENSITCYSSVSFALLPAVGPPHCTWFRRSLPGTGALAVTTEH